MIKLIVKCVKGHINEVEDKDGRIAAAGYHELCPESDCMLKAWVWTGETDNNMKHLDAPVACPHCGGDLTGGNKCHK